MTTGAALRRFLPVLLLPALACGRGEAGGGGVARRRAGAPGSATAARAAAADSTLPAWCRNAPRPAYDTLDLAFVSKDGWFQVYRIRPGVYALYEPHQFQEVISWLILGNDRALLLDTGMGMAPIRPVVERITDLPVTVLNTHTHPDHIGGNHEFDRILALDTPFTRKHAREGYPHDAVASQVAPDALCRPLPDGTDSATYRIRPFHITGTVSDGDTIDLGGRKLEILTAPGHAPDALAVLDPAAGLLFTGDTFYEGPIYLFSGDTDLDAYQKSVEKLAALVPRLELLLPSHNTPTAPPRMLTQLAEAVRAVRAGELKGTTSGGRIEYHFDGFSLLMDADAGGR